MEAPVLSPSLQTQQLTIPLTLSSPMLKMSHPLPSSPQARWLPPRSRGTHVLHCLRLGLTATCMASIAPNRLPIAQGITPLLVWTWAHEAWVLLWAPQLFPLASPHGLPPSTPPRTFWIHTITLRWAAGHPGGREAPPLCLWTIPCPARCHEILDFANRVGGVTGSRLAAATFISVTWITYCQR